MPLSTKVRLLFGVQRALTRIGAMPSSRKVAGMPVAKRLAFAPGARMVGPVPEVSFHDVQVPTRDGAEVRVRVYQPAGASVPLLYAHGGGFAIGGIAACDHICRRLAAESHAVVVSVEYRLAPEHRFPGPLQDCEDALDWLLTQGWDNSRLIVGGDSAGGNLAAALALRLRDRGTPLAGQLLIYPAVDLTQSGTGVRNYRGPGITPDEATFCADVYVGDGDRSDPYCSPLLADHTGLAPALVLVVEYDPLREEGLAYAARLLEKGVPTTLIDVPGHVHASLSLPVLYDGIDDLYARMSAFVRDPAAVTTA